MTHGTYFYGTTPPPPVFYIAASGGAGTSPAILVWSPALSGGIGTPSAIHDYSGTGIVPTKIAPAGGFHAYGSDNLFIGGVTEPPLDPTSDLALIREYTTSGAEAMVGTTTFTGNAHPEVVTLGPDGLIYITVEQYGGQSHIFQLDWTAGNLVTDLVGFPLLFGAWGSSFRPADGSFWASGFSDTIAQFSAVGAGPSLTPITTYTDSSGVYGRAFGGHIWLGDLLYMTDSASNAVVAFDPSTSTFTEVWNNRSDPNPFEGEDMALGSGRFYLSDRNSVLGQWFIASILPDGSDYRAEYVDSTPTYRGLGITPV